MFTPSCRVVDGTARGAGPRFRSSTPMPQRSSSATSRARGRSRARAPGPLHLASTGEPGQVHWDGGADQAAAEMAVRVGLEELAGKSERVRKKARRSRGSPHGRRRPTLRPRPQTGSSGPLCAHAGDRLPDLAAGTNGGGRDDVPTQRGDGLRALRRARRRLAQALSRYERVYGRELAQGHPTFFRSIENWRSEWLDRLGVRWFLASPGAASPVAEWRRAYSGHDATIFERTTAQALVRFDGASPAASPPILKRIPGHWEIDWPGTTHRGNSRLIVSET